MFLNQIKKITWQTECNMSVPYRTMTVQKNWRDYLKDFVRIMLSKKLKLKALLL